MQTAMVSGGNGFVASSLIRWLTEQGVVVHAVVKDNHQNLDAMLPATCIHSLRHDVASAADVVARVQPDTIFHLAAVYKEPMSADLALEMIQSNISLGICLLFGATQCAVRPVFVNAGTYWQFDADSSYSPNTFYAATKHAFQDLLQYYRERLNFSAVTLILYDTFGEHDLRPKLWQRLLNAPAGSEFFLTGGEQIVHLVHIDDIVRALILAAGMLHNDQPHLDLYTLSAPAPATLRSLVEYVNEKGHLGLDLKWGAIPYPRQQIFKPMTTESLPGWSPKVDVPSAIVKLALLRRAETAFTHGTFGEPLNNE